MPVMVADTAAMVAGAQGAVPWGYAAYLKAMHISKREAHLLANPPPPTPSLPLPSAVKAARVDPEVRWCVSAACVLVLARVEPFLCDHGFQRPCGKMGEWKRVVIEQLLRARGLLSSRPRRLHTFGAHVALPRSLPPCANDA
jgi:hypothetical protein